MVIINMIINNSNDEELLSYNDHYVKWADEHHPAGTDYQNKKYWYMFHVATHCVIEKRKRNEP